VLEAATAQRLDLEALEQHMAAVEDQEALRRALPAHNLVAFVGNDAILARQSGIDDHPLKDAIPFQSPESLTVRIDTPQQRHRGRHGGTTGHYAGGWRRFSR